VLSIVLKVHETIIYHQVINGIKIIKIMYNGNAKFVMAESISYTIFLLKYFLC